MSIYRLNELMEESIEENKEKSPKFSQEQVDYVCYIIGEWYLIWKSDLMPSGDIHHLGFAKEGLKKMLFPEYPE